VRTCETCKSRLEREYGRVGIRSWPKDGLTLTNVEEKPKTFYSKAELSRYCKDNKIESGALL
jgi:hypothetical protein